MTRLVLAITAIAGALAVLAGCASTPQASLDRDAEAKQFITHPGAATIYIYRDDFLGTNPERMDSALYVDNRLIGATLPRTYFRVDLRPGRRLLRGHAHDIGRLAIDTRSGELYIVSLNVIGGHSRFALVENEAGKRAIRACCVLLESWAPGQRPLLR